MLVEAFDLGRGCIGLPVYGATAGRSACLVIEGGLLCTGIDRKVLWWALVERSPNKKNGDENTKGDQAEAAAGAGMRERARLCSGQCSRGLPVCAGEMPMMGAGKIGTCIAGSP